MFKQIFDKEIKVERNFKKIQVLRNVSPASITSYRFDDWKELIKLTIKSSPIIGNGTQSDRFLIKQTASNGLIYFFQCWSSWLFHFYYDLFSNNKNTFKKKNSKYLRINNFER